MWRYFAGGVGALLLAAAAIFVVSGRAPLPVRLESPGRAPLTAAGQLSDGGDVVPAATAKTREEKRFGRYDKDKNGAITREEYLASRRKAYAKLDINHDGMLSFDEWATKTTTKFADADTNHDGAMSRTEFATTAPKKSARAKPKCLCPPAEAAVREDDN